MRKFYISMLTKEAARKLYVQALFIGLLTMHYAYVCGHFGDGGIYISTILSFLLFRFKVAQKWLFSLQKGLKWWWAIVIVVIAMVFTPHLYTTGLTLGIFFVSALYFPTEMALSKWTDEDTRCKARNDFEFLLSLYREKTLTCSEDISEAVTDMDSTVVGKEITQKQIVFAVDEETTTDNDNNTIEYDNNEQLNDNVMEQEQEITTETQNWKEVIKYNDAVIDGFICIWKSVRKMDTCSQKAVLKMLGEMKNIEGVERKFCLQEALNLSYKPAVRLYVFLSQLEESITLSTEDLREVLGLSEDKYRIEKYPMDSSNVEHGVLKPAQKILDENGTVTFTYEKVRAKINGRQGRQSVAGFVLTPKKNCPI